MASTNMFSKLNFERDPEEEIKVQPEVTQPKENKKKRKVRRQDAGNDDNDDDFQEVTVKKAKRRPHPDSEKYEKDVSKPDDRSHQKGKERRGPRQPRGDGAPRTDNRGKNPMDKRSRTGYDKTVKKGGAGGRGTWGNAKNEARHVEKHQNVDDLYSANVTELKKEEPVAETEEPVEKVEEKVEEKTEEKTEEKVEEPKKEVFTLDEYRKTNNVSQSSVGAGAQAQVVASEHKKKGKQSKVHKSGAVDATTQKVIEGLNFNVEDDEVSNNRRDYKDRKPRHDKKNKKFRMTNDDFPEL